MRDMKSLDAFFQRVRESTHRALLLDYDGTLAPFRRERDRAAPYAGVPEALTRLAERGATRLVLVSGRSADEVRRLLGLQPAPEIWGGHGWERRTVAGECVRFTPPAAVARTLAAEWNWLVAEGLAAQAERKVASVALHWRGLPAARARSLAAAVRHRWESLPEMDGLELLDFAAGCELRAAGRDKGVVVSTILDEEGPDCVAAYLGDDRTDEDAFRAIAGRGLGVLVAAEQRPTAADHWLRPPRELLAFLERWSEAAEAGDP
jgi:trehalose 6-phosphate phosphatase